MPVSSTTSGARTLRRSGSGCGPWPGASCGAGPYGDLWALEQLWARLGRPERLPAPTQNDPRRTLPVERACFATVANRCLASAATLSCFEPWLPEDVRLAGADALELPHLFRRRPYRSSCCLPTLATQGSRPLDRGVSSAGAGVPARAFGRGPPFARRCFRQVWDPGCALRGQ